MSSREAPSSAGAGPGLALLEVLRRTTDHLRRHGSPTPRLDAELLLAQVLDLGRIDLYLQFERPLVEEELARLRPLLAERARGRPVSLILGRKEFYGLTFEVTPATLVPRPESELLIELGLEELSGEPGQVADLGCGSGCLGLALAHGDPLIEVDLVDIEPAALEVAGRNAARLGVGDRVHLLQGSWAEPLAGRGPYRLVVANPPYLTTEEWQQLEPGVRDYEPRSALDGGPDGLGAYRALLSELAGIAAPRALLLLEGDFRRLNEVAGLAKNIWPSVEVRIHPDLTGRDRVLSVRLP